MQLNLGHQTTVKKLSITYTNSQPKFVLLPGLHISNNDQHSHTLIAKEKQLTNPTGEMKMWNTKTRLLTESNAVTFAWNLPFNYISVKRPEKFAKLKTILSTYSVYSKKAHRLLHALDGQLQAISETTPHPDQSKIPKHTMCSDTVGLILPSCTQGNKYIVTY